MSNVLKNSLLIIVAVIICVAASIAGSRAFAQSDLLFPVSSNVSYTAPTLDAVFATLPQVDVFVAHTASTDTVLVTVSTDTYIEEVPAEESFIVHSALRFPVYQRASYSAPNLDVVFTTHPHGIVNSYTEEIGAEDAFLVRSELRFPVVQRASYTAPDLKDVFTGISHEETSTIQITTYTRDSTVSKKHIARKIASLQKQIADLEQRLALLTEHIALEQQVALPEVSTANDFGCGSCGTHVKRLQRFLNRHGFILATTGAGSVGLETSFFGPRTLASLKEFQSAHNLPVTGVADMRTRQVINSIESNALGTNITADCVTPEKENEQEETIQNDRNDTDGTESTSGNFFTNIFKKIARFFRNLFLIV